MKEKTPESIHFDQDVFQRIQSWMMNNIFFQEDNLRKENKLRERFGGICEYKVQSREPKEPQGQEHELWTGAGKGNGEWQAQS